MWIRETLMPVVYNKLTQVSTGITSVIIFWDLDIAISAFIHISVSYYTSCLKHSVGPESKFEAMGHGASIKKNLFHLAPKDVHIANVCNTTNFGTLMIDSLN